MIIQFPSQREKQQHPASPARSWQVIAAELSKEQNADKVLALSVELTQALDREATRA